MSEQEIRSPRWGGTTKLIVGLTAVTLIGLTVWRFQIVIAPLVTAVVIAYFLNPLITVLAARLRWPRTAVVAIIYLSLLLALIALVTGLGLVVVNQISNLNLNIQQIVESLPGRIDALLHSNLSLWGYTLDLSQLDLTPLYDQIISSSRAVLSQAGTTVARAASSTAEFFGWALFVLVISFYITKDIARFGVAIDRYAADPGYQYDVSRLTGEFSQIWNAFLRGQAILGLTIAIINWIGLTILGVRYAFGLGLLAGLLEFIPIIGPLLAGSVGTAVALFQDGNWLHLTPWAYAAIVALFFLAVQQVENNFLVPRIIGRHLNLHPIFIMVGAIIGATMAGVLGLLLAAPVVATLRMLGRYAWRKMMDLPPFPDPEPGAVSHSPSPAKWPDVKAWLRRVQPKKK